MAFPSIEVNSMPTLTAPVNTMPGGILKRENRGNINTSRQADKTNFWGALLASAERRKTPGERGASPLSIGTKRNEAQEHVDTISTTRASDSDVVMDTIDPALLGHSGSTSLAAGSDTSAVGALKVLVSRRRYRRVKSRSILHSTTDKKHIGQKHMMSRPVVTKTDDQRAEPDFTRHIAKMVLSFILIQNRQGKTRLAKWYAPYSDEEKVKLKGEVHRLIAPRDQKHQSNFVEFRNMSKIVYRRYAGLFFCACVDTNDNELAYLEAIHFFVEVLDAFFGNVCELDLVFNFYKVYAILDEVFLAGEIEETSKQVVLTRLAHLDKLE
ncbi:uncharacterized protein ALTATR162_LOCUS11086 [Alternaria atra]|uniref:AP-2 complex subunit sigma n=17 Tax=Pleosporales TaxID=92860 RepID=A0A8J2IAM6_9PLEO|nr:uncharacterized protein ALTATR162_LOCUS11086 [Alternaria atra]CAG5184796.1 unnamed protein product [Alternaria atra]